MEEQNKSKGLAVITGASSGIGYELAKVFAEEGYPLLVAAEDQAIYEVVDSFRQYGVAVEPMRVDLATFEGVEALAQKIRTMTPALECIAINAGVGSSGAFVETDLRKELNLIQLNVTSTVHLTKLVLPSLVARGEGKILFTSSIAGEMPGPFQAVYAASKAFIQSFSEALTVELKDTGITVTALQPGATETEFFERAGMMDTKVGQQKKDSAAKVAREGFEAMMDEKDHVVAGSLMNKVQVAVGKFLSQKTGAEMQSQYTKPKH